MKAATYCRVSTEEQSSEGFSLAAQLNALKEYCIKNNIEIYNSYVDEGISGTKEDRPAFQKMLNDAEKGFFNVILVHKFDRFARKVEISQRVKSRMKKSNVNVISITEPIEDSPIGFFQEGILELLSEYFIKNLSNEIKKGQKERASQGKHHGRVPYGYGTKNGEAFVIEEEAKIVKYVYEQYLQGDGHQKISERLNNMGVPTKMNKKWEYSQLKDMLTNPVYTGCTVLNGVVYESDIQPIISKKDFETAQRERGIKNEKYCPYRTDRMKEFLFLGLLRCRECGSAFRTHVVKRPSSNRINNFYVCNTGSQYSKKYKCTFSKYFNVKKLEKVLLDNIYLIASDISVEIKTKRNVKIVDIVDNYAEKLIKELKRAKEAYMAGVFDLSEYSQIRSKLEKELKEIDNNPAPLPEIDVRDNIISVLKEFEQYPEEDIISRKQTLRKIIEYIGIGREGIEINFL